MPSAESDTRKQPDAFDLAILNRISSMPLPAEIPTNRFPIEQMYHGSRLEPKGFTNSHHFFLPRAAHSLAALWRKANAHPDIRIRHMLLFFVEQAIWGLSVLNRYGPYTSRKSTATSLGSTTSLHNIPNAARGTFWMVNWIDWRRHFRAWRYHIPPSSTPARQRVLVFPTIASTTFSPTRLSARTFITPT